MKLGSFLPTRTLKSEKVRFGLVGVVNTSVDFIILFVLARLVGVPTIAANMISTISAVGVSYLLNKKTVFKSDDQQGARMIAVFVIVTLTGLWGLQSIIIIFITTVLSGIGNAEIVLLIAKIIATLASLVWNYVWYSRVIFRKKS